MAINYRVSTSQAKSLYNCTLPLPIIICADKSLLSSVHVKTYVLIAAEFFQSKKEHAALENFQTKNNIGLIDSANLLKQNKDIKEKYLFALNKMNRLEEKEIFIFEDKNTIE